MSEPRENEYKCYGVEIMPTIEIITNKELNEYLNEVKDQVNFLGFHPTLTTQIFIFSDKAGADDFEKNISKYLEVIRNSEIFVPKRDI